MQQVDFSHTSGRCCSRNKIGIIFGLLEGIKGRTVEKTVGRDMGVGGVLLPNRMANQRGRERGRGHER